MQQRIELKCRKGLTLLSEGLAGFLAVWVPGLTIANFLDVSLGAHY